LFQEGALTRVSIVTLAAVAALTGVTAAQDPKGTVLAAVDAHRARAEKAAMQIWDYAEVGYQEEKSSALLQQLLSEAGFSVEKGVAGMPTAFVASYGKGRPVIGILAEFDALPGITQEATPERAPATGKDAGHACGHHLFGAGSTLAAIAVREWLAKSGRAGTIRLYGTPAEEGGAGKVYMVREGLFKDVDAVLHWHAADRNDASHSTSLANKSAKFRFHGVSAHAAGAPERGRSALDGVEAMNYMVNLMREHVPQDTRIHYVITHGGSAPNVIPDFAEVFYYVRHPDPQQVQAIFERVEKAAQGAAMGTGTRVEHEIIHGIYAVLPNEPLARAMDANMRRVGGVVYDAKERAFAEVLRKSLGEEIPPLEQAAEIGPVQFYRSGGSTDVADVSWVVPTGGLRTATWVPGTPAHSWQAIAAGGTTIGLKGMLVAAKTLAMTAVDLFTTPTLVADATAAYKKQLPPGWTYRPLVGDRKPPLDYRKR
jgi:aminobenzoyl-glutamate utilization protein B